MRARPGLVLVAALTLGVTSLTGLSAAAQAAETGDTFAERQYGLDQVRAQPAWATSTGSGAVIAVVDSGVDLDHPDLDGKLLPGATFLGCGGSSCGSGDWESGPEARRSTSSTHGTHVAGIAAAETGNGIGIAGVARDAAILPVKVLDEDGGSFSDIAAGIDWSVAHGADVINLSLGALPGVQVLTLTGVISDVQRAIAAARANGVVVVAAAGNDFASPLCGAPAFDSGALCVVATDKREQRSTYSNLAINQDLDVVAAPGGSLLPACGEDIVSTVPIGTGRAAACGYGEDYDEFAGTSMATPHVAGVAGLLAAQGRSDDDIMNVLLTTSRQPLTEVRGVFTPSHGFGIVDAAAAVATAVVGAAPSPAASASPTVNPTTSPSPATSPTPETSPTPTPSEGPATSPTPTPETSPTSTPSASPTPSEDPTTSPTPSTSATPSPTSSPTDPEAEPVVAPPAERAQGVTRFDGPDRFTTAVATSRGSFPGTANDVFIVTGSSWPDALSAGPAAASADAPVLPVTTTAIPHAIGEELDRLQPRRAWVVGGSRVVTDRVLTELRNRGIVVTRIAGADRYSTAGAVAARFFPGAAGAYYASGDSYADALGGGAAAAHRGWPLLLTARDSVPGATTKVGSERIVLGGPSAVSEKVRAQLEARRVGGADRYSTAAAIALDAFADAQVAYLATGLNFPDALAGTTAAARDSAPLLLAATTCVPQGTKDAITGLGATSRVVLGGTAVVSDEAADLATC